MTHWPMSWLSILVMAFEDVLNIAEEIVIPKWDNAIGMSV